eukprot:3940515-Rhodomonas_salina.1
MHAPLSMPRPCTLPTQMPGQNQSHARQTNGKIYKSKAGKAEICIFALIPFHNATWTQKFAEDFWQWNQEVAVMSFAQQTYTDFTLLAPRPPGGFTVKMTVVEMRFDVREQVEEMVAAKGTCSWVVSTRLDGDDFLLPGFMKHLEACVRKETVVADPSVQAIVMAHPSATVISVDGNDSQLCDIHKYSIKGGTSLGQTLAVRHEAWNRSGGLLITDCDHTKVISTAALRLGCDESNIRLRFFRKERGLVMYTRLSGHFPWNQGLPSCNKSNVESKAGFPIISWLENKPIPNTPLQDVCQSNRYFGNIESNRLLFNQNETCLQMSRRYGHALLPRNQTRLKNVRIRRDQADHG